MKRLVCIILSCLLFVSISTAAFAATPQDILISSTEEILENGDTIITEIYLDAIQPYSGTSGHSTKAYYSALGVKIWDLTVSGTFTYTGSSSSATSASASLGIYNNNAAFVSKNAYCSGNTATATGSVNYQGVLLSMSVSLSCDAHGNLYQ